MPKLKNDKKPAPSITDNSFSKVSSQNIQGKGINTTGSIRLKEVMH